MMRNDEFQHFDVPSLVLMAAFIHILSLTTVMSAYVRMDERRCVWMKGDEETKTLNPRQSFWHLWLATHAAFVFVCEPLIHFCLRESKTSSHSLCISVSVFGILVFPKRVDMNLWSASSTFMCFCCSFSLKCVCVLSVCHCRKMLSRNDD